MMTLQASSRAGAKAWVPLVAMLLLAGCGGQPSAPADQSAPSPAAAPKRVVAIVRGDVPTLVPDAPGPVPGLSELKEAINVGLVTHGPEGSLVARLVEEVPTTENGLWAVLPEGRMETTWKIRADALWHDGTPITADDLVFTTKVWQDQRMPFAGGAVYRSIDSVEARDARTLIVKWKNIYLRANEAQEGFEFPFPRHILEPVYESGDTERLLALPFWTEEFVGSGPFQVRSWTVGSGAVLEAFPRYLLGKPHIDVVEIKFIADPNTIAANLLAGEADVTFGGRLPLDWAEEITSRSPNVRFGTNAANPMVLYLNMLAPEPAALREVEFRRALVHALDRQAMMEALVSGLTAIAHTTILNPSRGEEFRALDRHAVKYAFDPGRATQLIEGLGYRKGPDGIFRDTANQPITMEIRTTQGDVQQERSMFSTLDYWQQIGLGSAPVVVPSARRGDREYRNTFPAGDMRRQPHAPENLRNNFHSVSATLPERGYRGNNYMRYVNPELDALIDLHDTTIPRAQRWETLGKIVRLLTDQVPVIGLYYDVEITAVTSRMVNVHTRDRNMGESWNIHEWDLK